MKRAQPEGSAPALARGVKLLEQLAVDGQASLEQLASKNGWPKSSTLRYLKTLESLGAVLQHAETRHWRALRHLTALESAAADSLTDARAFLPRLAEQSGHCAELYEASGRQIRLMDRADPENSEVRLLARIGHQRDLRELDATAAVLFAFTNFPPPSRMWQWRAGERHVISKADRDRFILDCRKQGVAADREFNEHGIRRFACPAWNGQELVGILAVAQRQTPRAENETDALLDLLRRPSALTSPPERFTTKRNDPLETS